MGGWCEDLLDILSQKFVCLLPGSRKPNCGKSFFSQKGVCRECYASLMRMSVRLEIAPFRNGRQQLTGVGSTLYTWEAVFTMFAVWKGLAVGRIQHRIWIFAWLFR